MGSFTLVGLGPGDPGDITARAREVLLASPRLVVSTLDHPVVRWLETLGRELTLLESMTAWPGATAGGSPSEALLEYVRHNESTTLATPGHPLVDHPAHQRMVVDAEALGIAVMVVPGLSYRDASLEACSWSSSTLQVLNPEILWPTRAADPEFVDRPPEDPFRGVYRPFDPTRPVFVGPIFQPEQLRKVTAGLAAAYGAAHVADVVSFDRTAGARHVAPVSLAALAWDPIWSSLCLLVEPIDVLADLPSFDTLRYIVARLRAPSGCPWDREQDYSSIKKHLVEESYEAIAALEESDFARFAEELGDVLLQVVMYAQFGRELGDFTIEDVLTSVNQKLVRRHPHVFGDVAVANSAEVLRNWEAIKRTEKNGRDSIFGGIPESAPALMRADAIQSRATRLGWVAPSTLRLADDVDGRDPEGQVAELGMVLFDVVTLARRYGIDPEAALRLATNRFRDSFASTVTES